MNLYAIVNVGGRDGAKLGKSDGIALAGGSEFDVSPGLRGLGNRDGAVLGLRAPLGSTDGVALTLSLGRTEG